MMALLRNIGNVSILTPHTSLLKIYIETEWLLADLKSLRK